MRLGLAQTQNLSCHATSKLDQKCKQSSSAGYGKDWELLLKTIRDRSTITDGISFEDVLKIAKDMDYGIHPGSICAVESYRGREFQIDLEKIIEPSTTTASPTTKAFDPTSTLTSYWDVGACGPRGDDAKADLSQCPQGHIVLKQVANNNYAVAATISGCDYFAYTVYECKATTAATTTAAITAAATTAATTAQAWTGDASWCVGMSHTAYVSTGSSGYTHDCSKLFDGDINTDWNPYGCAWCGRYANDWWVELDFGTPKVVTEMRYKDMGNRVHGIKDAVLQTASSQGGSFTGGIVTVSGQAVDTTDWHSFLSSSSTPVQYVRLYITATPIGWQPKMKELQFRFQA